MHYLVAICQWKQEFSVVELLGKIEGLDVFCPTYKTMVRPRWRNSKGLVEVVRPLYGRYVFVGLERDLVDSVGRVMWKTFFGLKGIAGLIMNDYNPVWIHRSNIDEIRDIDWNAEVNIVADEIVFGDYVEISVGPFASFPGKYLGKSSGKDFVRVFLFGQENVVPVPISGLKKISEARAKSFTNGANRRKR